MRGIQDNNGNDLFYAEHLQKLELQRLYADTDICV